MEGEETVDRETEEGEVEGRGGKGIEDGGEINH